MNQLIETLNPNQVSLRILPIPVDQKSKKQACHECPYLEQTVDKTLRFRGSVANAVQYDAEIVGVQSVATPLGEEADTQDDEKALAVTFRLQKGYPSRVLRHFCFKMKSDFDLFDL